MRPYYVFLNKPYKNKTALRVHRHTVPPCIPLAALAKRHLPSPSPADDGLKSAKQSLVRFVRALRGEIAAYHNRLAVLRGMRKAFALDGSGPSDKGKSKDIGVSDVSAADAEMRQIRIEWHDGKIGRIVVSEKGDVLKAVIFGDEGRDRPTERCIQGGDRRVEGVAERLLSM
jgi:central kinetochore subunit Mal2/MCM21